MNSPLELVIPHLKKFTQYTVVVQAFNRMGAGPRNQEMVVTTGEDGNSMRPVRYVLLLLLLSTYISTKLIMPHVN